MVILGPGSPAAGAARARGRRAGGWPPPLDRGESGVPAAWGVDGVSAAVVSTAAGEVRGGAGWTTPSSFPSLFSSRFFRMVHRRRPAGGQVRGGIRAGRGAAHRVPARARGGGGLARPSRRRCCPPRAGLARAWAWAGEGGGRERRLRRRSHGGTAATQGPGWAEEGRDGTRGAEQAPEAGGRRADLAIASVQPAVPVRQGLGHRACPTVH